jgi:cell wall-associated NlpC family hydrolase
MDDIDDQSPLVSTRAAKTTRGQLIVKAAEKWLGKKYVFGGGDCSGPTKGGFDCSGEYLLVHFYVFHWLTSRYIVGLVLNAVCKVTGAHLPHLAQGQYNLKKGKHIKLSQIQPGDALFWATNKNCKSKVHHVAIYIGKNSKGQRQIVHAPHTGTVVKKATVWTDELCGTAVR